MTELPIQRTSPSTAAPAAIESPDRTILHVEQMPFARTLVFAPHPDDESIGAGALIAAIASRGGSVRVVYMTDGDNNPWPQRAARRQWRLADRDHREWARLRRLEARHALTTLGVAPCSSTFLGLPDDGLADVDRDVIVSRTQSMIDAFAPTLVVIPSRHDFHPDHRATHRAVLRALTYRPMILGYLVHGEATPACRALAVDGDAFSRKRKAVCCHRTQLLLSRSRFMRYATRPERFAVVHDVSPDDESKIAAAVARLRHVVSLIR
jgi:LmbE family N-acetylglucosaminyl deacetylase